MEKRFGNVYVKRFLYFNVYVIKGKNGDILIDTGFVCMRESLRRWLKKFNIRLIILTHAHADHVWNVAYLKDLYGCEVAMSRKDVKNLNMPFFQSTPVNKRFNAWTKLMHFGMKKFSPDYFNIDFYLKDNQVINRYGIKLRIFNLSGHTEGSIGIKYKDYLFVGDALVNRKDYIEIAYQNQNHEAALKACKKILKLRPKIIFVGHDNEIAYNKLMNSMEYISNVEGSEICIN